MIRFDADTLYPLSELRESLAGVVEWPTFEARLGLRGNRVFRDAVWGWEILEASRKAGSFSEAGKAAPADVVEVMRPGRGGRGRGKGGGGTRRISASELDPEPDATKELN